MHESTLNTPVPTPREAHLTDETLWGDAATTVDTPRRRRRLDPRLLLGLVLGLVAGAAAGALVARQRYHAANIVLSVNGSVIESRDFYHRMEVISGDTVLGQMLAEELTRQYARQLGVTPTEAQVAARFKEMSSRPDWGRYLAATRQTPDDVQRTLRVQLAQVAIVSRGIQVSDSEVRDYYRAQTDPHNLAARFYTPVSMKIAIIVTGTEADSRRALADLEHGTPFEKVAQKYSRDPSRDKGGVLPPILRGRTPASTLPGVEKEVFGLEVGQQIGPKKIANGWWIIRCLGKSAEIVQPFEKVREDCRSGALMAKSLHVKGRQVMADFQAFQRAAKTVVFWPQYSYMGSHPGSK